MGDINKTVTYLFKKSIGKPNAFPDNDYSSEVPGDARMKVFSYQILQQIVPRFAPGFDATWATPPEPPPLADELTQDSSFVDEGAVNFNDSYGTSYNYGTKFLSKSYPHIVQYKNIILNAILPGRSYYYTFDFAKVNVLTNVIPFNFDEQGGSYNINVYDSQGNEIPKNDPDYSWIFDGDVGFLYFIGPTDFVNEPPSITFWRYEGIIGLDNVSGGSTGPTGEKGIPGIPGTPGPTGEANNYTFLQNNSNTTNLLSINSSNAYQPENNEINYSNITITSDNNSIDIPGKITIGENIELKSLNTIPTTNNYSLWINNNYNNNLYLNNKNLEYANNWINNNFLGPPPNVIVSKLTKSLSTSIYFCWDYPQQVKLSFLPAMVPYINSLFCSYNAVDINMSSLTGTIINNETGNDYIKYYEINTTDQVKGFILIKQNPCYIGNILVQSGSIYNIQFPFNYGLIRSYIYYDSNLANIVENPSNNFNIYYSNYNGHTENSTQVNFKPFVKSYPPSQPFYSEKSVSPTEITINISQPQYGDSVNITEIVKLDNYKIINQIQQNLIRYYDLIQSDMYNEFFVDVDSVVNNTITIQNLFSDTQYSITAYVKNIYVNEYNNISPTFFSITQSLEPRITIIEDISLNIIFITAKKVLSNVSVSNLYLIDGTTKQTLPTKFPIHDKNNRGKLQDNSTISTISCNIVKSNTVFIQGPSKDLFGFPIQDNNNVNTNGINLSITTPVDSYSINNKPDINNKNCGYYLESTTIISLQNSVFTPSENEYTLNIQRTGLNGNTSISSYNYFCDLYPSTGPSIGSVIINNIISNSTAYKYVSGIYVFNGLIRLNMTVNNINNIGKYFYNNINILTYNNNNTSSIYTTQQEIGLYNVIDDPSSYIKNTNQPSINGPITINNNYIYFEPEPNYYSETLIMNVKAYNVLGTYTSQDSTPFHIIIDPLSINLINTLLKQTIDLSIADINNFNSGFRVWSGQTSETNNLPPILFNNKRLVEYPYDNSWDISSLQELQICNGKFITKQSSIETGNGYKDYRNCYYNTTLKNDKDYSQISGVGYRYATFAWNIGNPPNNKVYSKLMIQIVNTNIIMKEKESMVYIDNNYTKRALLYYRFEKKTDPLVYNNSYSTNWIDGNNTEQRRISQGNYYLDYPLCGTLENPYINYYTTTFNLLIPINIMSSNFQDYNLYVRIGTPQEINFLFENIKVQLL